MTRGGTESNAHPGRIILGLSAVYTFGSLCGGDPSSRDLSRLETAVLPRPVGFARFNGDWRALGVSSDSATTSSDSEKSWVAPPFLRGRADRNVRNCPRFSAISQRRPRKTRACHCRGGAGHLCWSIRWSAFARAKSRQRRRCSFPRPISLILRYCATNLPRSAGRHTGTWCHSIRIQIAQRIDARYCQAKSEC
jgi:hypothetical protein